MMLGGVVSEGPGEKIAVTCDWSVCAVAFRDDELVYDASGLVVSGPSCFDLEHRNGICPHGLSHKSTSVATFNTVLDTFFESIIDQFTGTASPLDLQVTQVAIGTSSAPTTQGMTQLAAEFARKVPSDVIKVSATQATIFFFFAASEGNAPSDLQEFALLANGATSTPGSGDALNRWLAVFTKTSGVTLTGQANLTLYQP